MADNKLKLQLKQVDLAGLASAGSAPVNIGKYQQSLNEAIYAQEAATAKPYDYDAIDWGKDWFTDFQVKRNEINYQTRLGDIIQQQEDLDNIDKAKRYIDNQKEISKYPKYINVKTEMSGLIMIKPEQIFYPESLDTGKK